MRSRRVEANGRTRRASDRCAFREAAHRWMRRRFDVDVPVAQIGASIGTKEFVATLPQWMKLRDPSRDTVLYPAIAYPTYEMGAILAGCRAVPIGARPDGTLDLDSILPEDADRALLLWVNSPGNPTGALDDLEAAAAVGSRARRSGLLRRVLRRVHLEGPGPHDPGVRSGRPGRGPLAVETLEPRRPPGGLLRGRSRAGQLPAGDPQARRDDGARPGAGGRDRRAGRRRPRDAAARALPEPARTARLGALDVESARR